MIRVVLIGFAMVCAAPAFAQAQPSEIFAGLTRSCWEGVVAEGVTDTHCFSVAVGGKLVMDIHKVRTQDGAVIYEGVTTYRLDTTSGLVRYEYFNSNGDLRTGYARRDGQRIRFPQAPEQAGDLVWYLGEDAYEVGTAAVTAAKTRFRKVGPAPEGGF